jgi:hypothetical protein
MEEGDGDRGKLPVHEALELMQAAIRRAAMQEVRPGGRLLAARCTRAISTVPPAAPPGRAG